MTKFINDSASFLPEKLKNQVIRDYFKNPEKNKQKQGFLGTPVETPVETPVGLGLDLDLGLNLGLGLDLDWIWIWVWIGICI